jgi:hypothetical protein
MTDSHTRRIGSQGPVTPITVETYSAELQVRDPADVQRYQEVWARLVEGAVGGDEWISTSG